MAIDIRHSVDELVALAKTHPTASAVIATVGVGGLVVVRVLGSRAQSVSTPATEGAKYAGVEDYDPGNNQTPYATPVATPAPVITNAPPRADGKKFFGDTAIVPNGFNCPSGSKAIYDRKGGAFSATSGEIVCQNAAGEIRPLRKNGEKI